LSKKKDSLPNYNYKTNVEELKLIIEENKNIYDNTNFTEEEKIQGLIDYHYFKDLEGDINAVDAFRIENFF